MITKLPSTSVAAPKLVSGIKTLAPIRSSPVNESVTLPAILPVVPAYKIELK